jgi:hypothetical protein
VTLERVLLTITLAACGVDIYMGGTWAFLAAVLAFSAGFRVAR